MPSVWRTGQGGGFQGKKKFVPEKGLSFVGSLFKISIFPRGKVFWFWGVVWPGEGGVRQITPPSPAPLPPTPPWISTSLTGMPITCALLACFSLHQQDVP